MIITNIKLKLKITNENQQVLSTNLLTSRRQWIFDLVVLAGCITAFYLLWLGSYPLFVPDEGRYPEAAREMLAAQDYITPRVNGVAFLDKPVLYYWLQALAMSLFGVNEWAIRLFPALLGMFGCLVTYVSGRMLFNRRTGFLSAIILATTPLYFGNAHYADLNLEVAVFISSTLLFFLIAMTRNDKWRHPFLFAAYFFSACAFLTKGLIGVAFPCMIIGLWILIRWKWDIVKQAHLMKGLLLFLALVLPWYVLVQKANPQFLHYFFVTQQVTRFLSAAEFNNPTPIWFYVPIILIGAFPWTIFSLQAFSKHISNCLQAVNQHSKELYLLLWFFIVLIFFSIPRSKTIGYILPLLPAFALLTGHYLSIMWAKGQTKRIYFAIAIFILFSGLLGVTLCLLPKTQWITLAPAFYPFLFFIAGAFIFSAMAALTLIRNKNLLAFFSLLALCNVIFLLTLTIGAKYLNDSSTKPLTIYLKTLIQPQDEVVNYLRFYQDVPMYLGRTVTIAADWSDPHIAAKDNWQRELWLGMSFQKTNDWLINEDIFWKRWNSHKRLFVFTSENNINHFQKQKNNYFILGQYNDVVLLSNQIIPHI